MSDGPVIGCRAAMGSEGQYTGRCYKPADKLSSKLKQAGANGVGVFHWMNRPQDLYFKNVERQIRAGSVDEDCRITCGKMALDYFGDKSLGSYLFEWVNDAPIFGRATGVNMDVRTWQGECRFTDQQRADGAKRRPKVIPNARSGLMRNSAARDTRIAVR